MQINISYDASANSAPAAFKATITAVVSYYETTLTNPITLTIAVGYGEVDGQAISTAGESDTATYSYSWSQLRPALLAHATTPADQAAVAALPTADPSNGHGFVIAAAEAYALGLAKSPGTAFVGFSNTLAWNYDTSSTAVSGQLDLFGVVAHEMSEVMGRLSDVGTNGALSVMDLFRYGAPGTLSEAAGAPAYFSLDGGVTNLDNFNTQSNGDYGDWASSVTNDSYRAFDALGVANPVSTSDLAMLAALGYTLSPGAAPSNATAAASSGAATTTTATTTTPTTPAASATASTLPDISASFAPATQSLLNTALQNLGAGASATNVVQLANGTTGAAAAAAGQLNALVVNAAAAGTAASLPGGYSIGYLLGGDGSSLADSNGGALLAATTGGTLLGAAGDTLLGGSGHDIFVAGAGAETLASGTGGSSLFLGAGPDQALSQGADTIIGGSGAATVTSAGSSLIFGGGGALDVIGTGGAPTLVGGSGAATINAGAAASLVFGGGGEALRFVAGGAASTVVGGVSGGTSLTGGTAPLLFFGNGPASYTPGTAVDTILGGTGSLTATGGANGTLFFGGSAGGNQINSGPGASTIIGGGAGDVLTASGSGTNVIAAAGGAATLNGAASAGANAYFGGTGADEIIGGAGATAIVAGTGNDTLIAGAGATVFTIAAGVAGRADLIENFNPAADFVRLAGYGANAGAQALAAASFAGGSETLALSDGTSITFQGVTNLSAHSFV